MYNFRGSTFLISGRMTGKKLFPSRPNLVFLLAFLFGMLFACILFAIQVNTRTEFPLVGRPSFKKLMKKHATGIHERISPKNFKIQVKALSAWVDVPSQDKDYEDRDETVADNLTKSVKISCIVLTSEKKHNSNAKFIKSSWGARCTDLLFVSTKKDSRLGAFVFGNFTSDESKWGMVKAGLTHALKKFKSEWILKTEDSSYYLMENLRHMLIKLNSSESAYYGFRLRPKVTQGYMSGDPGYVMSRNTLKKLVHGFKNQTICRTDDQGFEDIEMGKCAENLGIIPADTRDDLQRYRFMPFTPEKHIISSVMRKQNPSFQNSTYYPLKSGLECCSDHAIAFSHLHLDQMHAMEYLLYHVHRYGVHHYFQ